MLHELEKLSKDLANHNIGNATEPMRASTVQLVHVITKAS